MKKKSFTIEELGLTFQNEQEKAAYGTILNVVNKAFQEAFDGCLDKEEVDAAIKAATAKLTDENAENLKTIEDLTEQIKNLGESIEKMKQRGMSPEAICKFDEKLNDMLSAPKFQDFIGGRTKGTGIFEGFSLKDISLTANYDGNYLLTQQQNRVENPYSNKPLHVRNVITTLSGEPEHTELVFAQVETMDRNARFVTENGELPESMVKFKEERASVRRLGSHIKISKRMLKSRAYVRSFILNMLPEAVFMAEDWQMLFGDESGENLKGLTKFSAVKAVEELISDAFVTIAADGIKKISGYDGNKSTLIEFSEPHPEIIDGMSIICTGAAVNTGLNSGNVLVKVTDSTILLNGVAYLGDETAVKSMTAKVHMAGFKSVEAPNGEDVIKGIFAALTYAQYAPNAIILNPIDVFVMETEKDTLGRSLNYIQIVGGRKTVAGRPIIEYSGIPVGKYLAGDFNKGAQLVEYTDLQLEWKDDVNTALKNQVVLMAQEEVIFPVYNPWSFAYGSLAAMKSALTKA